MLPFRKQPIPDAFTIPLLPFAIGFNAWLHTLITKVHAAAHGLDAAREWIAKVKRDPDFDKYECDGSCEALDIKLASAFKKKCDQETEPHCDTKGTHA